MASRNMAAYSVKASRKISLPPTLARGDLPKEMQSWE